MMMKRGGYDDNDDDGGGDGDNDDDDCDFDDVECFIDSIWQYVGTLITHG